MSRVAITEDTPTLRKARGAFFTPRPIAEYLAEWAVEDDPQASVLDPTCGEAVFLMAAAQRLKVLGATTVDLRRQVLGVDLHRASVAASRRLLRAEGLEGSFLVDDFFSLSTPDMLDPRLPYVDAVIGNPPFVRYQEHTGLQRRRAQRAALEQGVRLSGLASSWAALVVHACAFLKPEGRLAMVLPTELLTTGYAEEVRLWLKRRFKAVHLVMFERLQFDDALEKVVLVLARGTGGCNALTLVPVEDAADLPRIRMFGPMHLNVAPPAAGKWTDLLLRRKSASSTTGSLRHAASLCVRMVRRRSERLQELTDSSVLTMPRAPSTRSPIAMCAGFPTRDQAPERALIRESRLGSAASTG